MCCLSQQNTRTWEGLQQQPKSSKKINDYVYVIPKKCWFETELRSLDLYMFRSLRYACTSRPSEVFLRKGVLKKCSKFTGEHPCRSAISIKLLSNFIEITLQHGCSPVNLLNIFKTSFLKNTYGGLLLPNFYIVEYTSEIHEQSRQGQSWFGHGRIQESCIHLGWCALQLSLAAFSQMF